MSLRVWRSIALRAVAASLALVATVRAHPANVVNAQASVAADGTYHVRLSFDLPAYALNERPVNASDADMNALLDQPPAALARDLDDARRRFQENVTIVCDGPRELHAESLTFPTAADVAQRLRDGRRRLPMIEEVTLGGRLPADARTLAFRFPDAVGDLVLIVERPGEEPFGEPVAAGHTSTPLPIRLAAPTVSATPVAPSPGHFETAARFLRWGFVHIVPGGLDHILFVLGLYLLSTRWSALLWQVTAFTVAHSITLALAATGLARASPAIVEPLIAASIAFVAIENLCTRELKPWRPFVVFAFGLVHGLGFAGALAETGLPRGQLPAALVAFNVGVELGQLSVIAAAALLVGWFRHKPWYRRAIVVPASTTIAIVALFWTVTRLWGDNA